MKRAPGYSPYVNSTLRVNDRVAIHCDVSKYHGIEGIVFAIDQMTGYARVDVRKG